MLQGLATGYYKRKTSVPHPEWYWNNGAYRTRSRIARCNIEAIWNVSLNWGKYSHLTKNPWFDICLPIQSVRFNRGSGVNRLCLFSPPLHIVPHLNFPYSICCLEKTPWSTTFRPFQFPPQYEATLIEPLLRFVSTQP